MLKPTLDVKPHEIPVLKELLMIRKAVTALYIVNNGYPVQGFPVEQGFAVSKKKKVLTSLTRPQSRIRLVPRKVSFSRFFFFAFRLKCDCTTLWFFQRFKIKQTNSYSKADPH